MTDTIGVEYVLKAKDQASGVISKVKNELQQTEQATQKAGAGFGQLGQAVGGLITAYVGMQGVRMVEEMYSQGEAARRTDTAFQALTANIGNYNDVLRQIADATGHVVDNTTLQSAANLMLGTHVANTTQELAKFEEMAVKLGSVFAPGASASANLNNFTLMMSNQSVRRLDTFGISAEAVTRRMNELKAAGMDAQEAFKMAVMEQGTESLNRLGEAADVGETAVARLQTTWQNFMSDVSEGVANTLNSAITTLEQLWYLANAPASNRTTNPGPELLGVTQRLLDSYMTKVGIDPSTMIYNTRGAGAQAGTFSNINDLGSTADFLMQVARDRTTRNLYEMQQKQAAAAAWKWPDLNALNVVSPEDRVWFNQMQQGRMKGALGRATGGVDVLQQMYGSRGGIQSGMGIMSQAEADMISGAAREIADQAKAAKDNFKDMLSENQKSALDAAANSAKSIADDAQRAADNFNSMDLSQLMGQGGGGRMGQFEDLVLANVPADRQASAQRILDQMTGRTTPLSDYMNNTLAPMIGQAFTQNPQAAQEMMQNAMNIIEQGQLSGASQPAIINSLDTGGLGWQFQGTGGGQSFTVQPGQTASELALQYGVSTQDIMGAAGITRGSQLQAGQQVTLGGGGDLVRIGQDASTTWEGMAQTLQDNNTKIQEFTSSMDAIDGRTLTMTIDVKPILPQWLQTLIDLGPSAMVQETIVRNGGTPPGTTTTNNGSAGTSVVHAGGGASVVHAGGGGY